MLDFDVQTLLLFFSSPSFRQRQVICPYYQQKQMPELALRRLRRWLSATGRKSSENRLQQAWDSGQATGVCRVLEQIMRAFPGDEYRRVTRALQHAGARMSRRRTLQVVRRRSCLYSGKRGPGQVPGSRSRGRCFPGLDAC